MFEGRYRDEFAPVEAPVQAAIDQMPAVLPHQPPAAVLHGDFWWPNFFYEPEFENISAVIDWDWALGGDPLLDVATAEYLTADPVLGYDESTALRDGYVEVRPRIEPYFETLRYDTYLLFADLRAMYGFSRWGQAYPDAERESFAE